MELGQLLSQYLEEHDMSLRAFAERTGLSHAQISYYINGRNGKKVSATEVNLRKIATAMHLTMQELMECLDGEEVITFGTSDFDKLLDIYNSLGEQGQADLLQYADYLKVKYGKK